MNFLKMKKPVCPAPTVTINEKLFAISEYEMDNTAAQGQAVSGYMNQREQLIRYNRDQHLQQVKDTIMHEIIHAIEYDLQLSLTETQVHALATNLCALFWNGENKKLTDWLLKG